MPRAAKCFLTAWKHISFRHNVISFGFLWSVLRAVLRIVQHWCVYRLVTNVVNYDAERTMAVVVMDVSEWMVFPGRV